MEWDDQDFKNENSKKKFLEPLNCSRNVGLQEKWTVQQVTGEEEKVSSWLLGIFGPHSFWSLGAPWWWTVTQEPESILFFTEGQILGLLSGSTWEFVCLATDFGQQIFSKLGVKSLEAMAYPFPNPLPDHSQKVLPEACIYYHKHVFC